MDKDKKERINKFDEYKLFVDDTARFSERRQKVAKTYITVNSILIGLTGFLVKDSDKLGLLASVVMMLISIAGMFVCVSWK